MSIWESECVSLSVKKPCRRNLGEKEGEETT
jgi:hypothetical protein